MKAKFIQKMMAGALSIALVVAPSMSVLASTDPVTTGSTDSVSAGASAV